VGEVLKISNTTGIVS